MAQQNTPPNVDQSKTNSGKNSGLSSKQKILFGFTFLVLLAVIGGLLYLLLVKPAQEEKPEPLGLVTEDNVGSVNDDLAKKVSEGMFEIKMNTDWNFETATSPSSNAYIANSEGNTRTIYFELILDETGEVIFTSPYMPIKTKLDKLVLEKELAPGTHNATVKYHLLDEANKVISSVSVGVKLNILN